MSGPHGGAEPPAILLVYSDSSGGWVATAVMAMDPIKVEGPSSSCGRLPSDALQALLEKKFCALTDADCPATLVSIEQETPLAMAAQELRLPPGLSLVPCAQEDAV